MKIESVTELALQNYTFKKEKPIFTSGQYNVYNGTQTQSGLPVTIKTIRQYHLELPKYLKKIKDCKSENVIKVYQTISDNQMLVFITERVGYGNLGRGLQKCERLDDADSIFMSKMILNGHIELLRSDCNWFGTEEDIEFTETGIKLSWNNSISYNLVNPIPNLLERISSRPEGKAGDMNLLPFPKSKVMNQLIKISKENASEISLNPQMKKKQKLAKKKGKNWIGLKEYRNKNQYFDEYTYLAASEEYGIMRVKIYDQGKINPQLVALNISKRTFTKVINHYDESGKTIILSQYSNDGHLQAYVSKLKTSGVSLTEEHIQFFFYSMFEPLKQVQESSLKSINMLNIRNIYIENGIPKIGEPIPLNSNIQTILIDRAQVPDFYHVDFKRSPASHRQTFDTYSLGVLLYKLMYTQYPIFPNGKVHIPTTPNYNKRLKTTLEIFLNEGGKLKDIQARIEVSENVLKQVKENKQKLVVKKDKKKQDSKRPLFDEESVREKQSASESQKSQSSESEEEDGVGCCTLCCNKLQLSPNQESSNKNIGVISLEESPYKIYRICTKMILLLLYYIFVFYFFFLQSDVMLIANQNLLTTYNVTIATVDYPIITTDSNQFDTSFGKTSGTVNDLQNMNCLICSYQGNPDYSELLYEHSGKWIGFIVGALMALIALLVIKLWQLYNFDIIKAIYNYDHAKFQFNISHFVIFNLMWCCLVYGHYYFFNFIFTGQTEPCVGGDYMYASSEAFFNQTSSFTTVYVVTFCLQFVVVILHAIMIGCTHRVKYNRLVNPIVMVAPLLIAQWVVLRIGPLQGYFYPNALQDGNVIRSYFTSGQYINIAGTIPEILLLIELVLGLLVDVLYWFFLDKRRRLLINETSAASLGEI